MKSIVIIGGLLILFPNIFNSREKQAFGQKERLEMARKDYSIENLGDSVFVPAGTYYEKGNFHNFFFGEKYRKLWAQPVKVKVFDIDTVKGGMTPLELGGGMQTIGMDLLDAKGRKFDMRSVNKDQSKALPKWLRYTFVRSIFRDQAAAMDPYASVVVPILAEAAGIHHTFPELYFVPFDTAMKDPYRNTMAGRIVILERNLNDSWVDSPDYDRVEGFYDSDEMLEKVENTAIAIDKKNYLKNRLFDILINDWDRHMGQWEWALQKNGDSLVFRAYPKDRDMAFYDFRGGLVNSIALLFNNKFQSFSREIKNVKALGKNSKDLDRIILSDLPKETFIEVAEKLQMKIDDNVIDSAFTQYPPEIFNILGAEHIGVLRARRKNLHLTAEKFHASLQ